MSVIVAVDHGMQLHVEEIFRSDVAVNTSLNCTRKKIENISEGNCIEEIISFEFIVMYMTRNYKRCQG